MIPHTIVSFLLIWIVTSSCVNAQPAATKSTFAIKAVTDRPDAIYKVGDKATFKITLTNSDEVMDGVNLSYRVTLDGYETIEVGKLVSGKAATVSGTLAQPGFLRLTVEAKPDEKQVVTAVAGAAFDPQLIKPSLPVPDDFDAFWTDQKRALSELPMNPQLTSIASPVAEVECFDTQIACLGGKPVSGYFARPKDAKPKSLPAVLLVHGAGVRSSILTSAVSHAKRGRLAMDINAHGIANGKPQEFYDSLQKGELANYRHAGRDNRDTCYFKGMFLRLVRGIDFLCAQPEWDGRILIVSGASQGGGQALAAAGLDPRVTAIYAGVPALCDHSGNVAGRIAGWPKLVAIGTDKKPDPKTLQVARYFDGMNFATRTKANAILTVGFIDGVCPPSSVYATYNNLAGPKQIITGPLAGHEGPPNHVQQIDAFLTDHIARMQAAR